MLVRHTAAVLALWALPAAAQAVCAVDSCPTYERWVKFSSSDLGTMRSRGFLDGDKVPDFSGIGTTNDRDHKSALNYVYRPVNPSGGVPAHRDTLVVYLHGGKNATADNAQQFYAYVAGQGYFVIGLDWLNDASPTQLCTCNPDCYEALFQQLVDTNGADNGFYRLYFPAGSPLIGYNSIERRLGLLLQHMMTVDVSHQGEWSRFLDSSSHNAKPNWKNIIIAGHSDGSQLASWIVRYRDAKKGLFFSGPKTQLSRPPQQQMNADGDGSYTTAPLDCTPSETPPPMFRHFEAAPRMRFFLAYWDDRYEPGVTVRYETLSECLRWDIMSLSPTKLTCGEWSNGSPGWKRWSGGSQTRLIQFLEHTETRITQGPPDAPASCNTKNWTTWITATDTIATHGSTVGDDARWKPHFRECVWGWMLSR